MNNIIQTIRHTARAATVLLITLCAAQTAWAWTGSGTSADPYQIASASDLATLRNNVSGGYAQSIGAGDGGMCGKITIGCTFDEDGDPVDGEVFKRGIDESPYTYTPTN